VSDIVDELRLMRDGAQWACGATAATLSQAADEIEWLRGERDRLAADLAKAHKDILPWIERAQHALSASPAKPHAAGNIPETLRVLMGAIEIRRQFIKQAYDDSQEYWQCQRELANLERRWDEAEALWAKHVSREKAGVG
jgi:phage shock protein A